jgi:hypothetical protein
VNRASRKEAIGWVKESSQDWNKRHSTDPSRYELGYPSIRHTVVDTIDAGSIKARHVSLSKTAMATKLISYASPTTTQHQARFRTIVRHWFHEQADMTRLAQFSYVGTWTFMPSIA